MKNKRLRNRIIAIIAAMALIVLAAIPALAGNMGLEEFNYTPVSGTQTQFTKYLVINNNDIIPPNAEFLFDIDEASGTEGSSDTLPVKDGIGADNVHIYVGSITDEVEKSGSHVISFANYSGTFTSGAEGDGIADATDKKIAQQTVIVDFSGVSFPTPGVYRYTISEQNTLGFTTDSSKTMDVFVYDNEQSGSGAGLVIGGYILYDKVTTEGPKYGSGVTSGTAFPSGTEKSTGFVNKYPSCDIVVEKKVAGNQADKSEFFDFTLVISNAEPGTEYTVDISKMVVEDEQDGTNYNLSSEKITVGTDGSVTVPFKLQHGQSIRVYGLAEGTFYSVVEGDKTKLDKEGYRTTITVSSNGSGSAVAEIDPDERTIELSGTGSGAGIRQINEITFTNTKNGTLPTGVNMKVVPIVVVALLFIGGISVLTVRMARKENEE